MIDRWMKGVHCSNKNHVCRKADWMASSSQLKGVVTCTGILEFTSHISVGVLGHFQGPSSRRYRMKKVMTKGCYDMLWIQIYQKVLRNAWNRYPSKTAEVTEVTILGSTRNWCTLSKMGTQKTCTGCSGPLHALGFVSIPFSDTPVS